LREIVFHPVVEPASSSRSGDADGLGADIEADIAPRIGSEGGPSLDNERQA